MFVTTLTPSDSSLRICICLKYEKCKQSILSSITTSRGFLSITPTHQQITVVDSLRGLIEKAATIALPIEPNGYNKISNAFLVERANKCAQFLRKQSSEKICLFMLNRIDKIIQRNTSVEKMRFKGINLSLDMPDPRCRIEAIYPSSFPAQALPLNRYRNTHRHFYTQSIVK